ncbi:hypothetical protein AVEN_51539-1 [Araneus ventricosus]|uniref:Uncharacterized protein n=2 Tax=Araneus ventricosus TaxID=182803 RepID=A0A4Y2P742_ARAVE|nr:hypothetical protein AVEN_51539-1 [Araneus ventricosus]
MNPKRIAAMRLLYRRLRRRRIKRNYWVHPINQKREQIGIFHTLLKELQKDENKFFNFFRMTIPSFNELHQRLKTKILRKNSKMRNSITSEERLALTLRGVILFTFGVGSYLEQLVQSAKSRPLVYEKVEDGRTRLLDFLQVIKDIETYLE